MIHSLGSLAPASSILMALSRMFLKIGVPRTEFLLDLQNSKANTIPLKTKVLLIIPVVKEEGHREGDQEGVGEELEKAVSNGAILQKYHNGGEEDQEGVGEEILQKGKDRQMTQNQGKKQRNIEPL